MLSCGSISLSFADVDELGLCGEARLSVHDFIDKLGMCEFLGVLVRVVAT